MFSGIFCTDGLNNTLLFQDCVLENDLHCGNREESGHSNYRGEGEVPLIAHIQLISQLEVMPSQ